ncbi:MAG TPA: hypothetical protein DEE98_02125 [Elusimicrobia bacterium]|nr:MAG: hypothetical protein A2278_08245 [Elusimicrobia bacterium RIFOXYA12_FULL_49_49]OGS15945.1 MAG: hypothetical protein A2251_02020 [Elusimicrobia bacterium RIFOXYA2_FULL_47_53]OGS26373.1 MAG: hypothetical protein A2339_03250 [Elusimicrobia bacterium RIFOXYB12_FULL_50_12]OGS29113.1 MAG: hypothetical protein A2323_04560 [Elusimicrobia bacterium RIFOXYB2_FULL_46_23]HBU69159.1 hypothetical protein [Elusimicrobiota bacterium]
MKLKLMDHLICPACHGNLRLKTESQEAGEIISGELLCECGASYPVSKGVPRFAAVPSAVKQSPDTVESFGFEWQTHKQPYSREKLKKIVLEQCKLEESFFPGKLILDAGCGAGLQTKFMNELGAEVIGVDLSEAVNSAFENNKSSEKVHIIQADLNNLPLRKKTFDMAYSEGVLHHTPDPKASLYNLMGFVKKGGYIAAGFYFKMDRFDIGLSTKDIVRRILSVFPKKFVYYLCWLTVPLNKMPVIKNIMRDRFILFDPNNPDDKFTWCLNFDFFGLHKYQFYYTEKEVHDMFYNASVKLKDIVKGKINFFRATIDE